jgi:hypothetical protein
VTVRLSRLADTEVQSVMVGLPGLPVVTLALHVGALLLLSRRGVST